MTNTPLSIEISTWLEAKELSNSIDTLEPDLISTFGASHSLHTAHSNNTKQLFLDTNEKLIIIVIGDKQKGITIF